MKKSERCREAARLGSIVLAGFIAATLGAGCASLKAQAPGLVPASQVDRPTETEAVVVFIRPLAVGEGYAFPILDEDGNVLAYSAAESQFALHVAPGDRHLVLAAHGSTDDLYAHLAAGKKYYVWVVLRPSATGPRWSLTPIHQDDLASPELAATLARTPAFHLEPKRVRPDGVRVAIRSDAADPERTLRLEDGR